MNKVVKHGGLKSFLGYKKYSKGAFKLLKNKRLKFSKSYIKNKGLHVKPTIIKDLDDA